MVCHDIGYYLDLHWRAMVGWNRNLSSLSPHCKPRLRRLIGPGRLRLLVERVICIRSPWNVFLRFILFRGHNVKGCSRLRFKCVIDAIYQRGKSFLFLGSGFLTDFRLLCTWKRYILESFLWKKHMNVVLAGNSNAWRHWYDTQAWNEPPYGSATAWWVIYITVLVKTDNSTADLWVIMPSWTLYWRLFLASDLIRV